MAILYTCFVLPCTGCLIIGGTDGKIRERMTAVETRLERIEQMNGITPPPKPATTDDGIASTMTVKGKDCFGRSFGQ